MTSGPSGRPSRPGRPSGLPTEFLPWVRRRSIRTATDHVNTLPAPRSLPVSILVAR